MLNKNPKTDIVRIDEDADKRMEVAFGKDTSVRKKWIMED